MARTGLDVLIFDSIVLKTSELIEMSFNQDWDISSDSTISGINLTQRGALSLAQIDIEARLFNDVAIIIPQFLTVFQGKKIGDLTIFKTNYGKFYFTAIDFKIDDLDGSQTPLRAEMKLSFTQANESY